MDRFATAPLLRQALYPDAGLPLRSLRKAIRVQSGDSVGHQLPRHRPVLRPTPPPRARAATCRPARITGGGQPGRSVNIVVLQPHLQHRQLPQGVGTERGPGGVRVGQHLLDRFGLEQCRAAGPPGRSTPLAPGQDTALQLPDGWNREVALRPIDHLVGHHAAAGPLEDSLAAVSQLERWRYSTRELDHLMIEERHPGLQSPSHRHVVDPLDRVVDQHDRRVVAQRRIDRGLGTGRRSAP